MTCPVARQMMQESLDGTLAAESRAALNDHLAGCPACAADFASLTHAVEALDALPPITAPAELMERLGPQLDRISRRQRSWRWVPAGAIAAGLLVALTLTRLPGLAPSAPEQIAMEPPASEDILSWVDSEADPSESDPFLY